jgi:hypothetical protein
LAGVRFLLEHYMPRLEEATARAISRRLAQAAEQARRERVRIHWLHAVALPDEDSLLCLFDAEHLEDVLLASSCAGLRCPHAQQAIAIEPIA